MKVTENPDPNAETNIITIKNATSYNGVNNRGMIRLNAMTCAINDNANPISAIGVFTLKINATLGGTPTYTTVNGTSVDAGVTITAGNSIASYDTAGTTVTGGLQIFNIVLAANGNNIIDLTPFEIYIAPGSTLTASGASSNSAQLAIGINFSEDQ